METISVEPNFRTESWRSHHINEFKDKFELAMDKFGLVFRYKDQIHGYINENYDPKIPNYYNLHGSVVIPRHLEAYDIWWNPIKRELVRYNLEVASKGKGYGTMITNITEELANNLGVEKLIISTIINDRWKEKLINQGYTPDQKTEDKVYKILR